MPLLTGTRLGPYEITTPIGAGGMGEVYRATDTTLKRSVAIKVLPASVAGDTDRLARFQREAEVLAALNHPNIAQIYGLEKTPDLTALVMELVEGEDLSAHIARGPIAIADALPIARQIAAALEAAHEQGIVHRDLKPANVKVRADGTVKVLDFGLAKATDPAVASSADATNSPTMTARATQMGMIIGTAAYMAPEQAKGRAVDKRADIWSFGVVLLEMLTGRRAFEGDDITEVLAAVLKTEPDWTAIPASVPPGVRRLLRRCLEKDPKKRLRDIAEGMLQLDEPAPGLAGTNPNLSASHGRFAWLVAGAAVIVAIALAIPAVQHLRETAPPLPPETRTAIVLPADAARAFALSPDGRQIVFSADSNGTRQLWIRSLSSTTARPLPGTEAGARPFWSPDGRSIGFFAEGLKRIDVDGTNPKTLTQRVRPTSIGTWGADGVIVFDAGVGPLYRATAGGAPQPVTKLGPGEEAHVAPHFLPDGRRFVFTVVGESNTAGVYLGALDGRAPRRLTPEVGMAQYWSGSGQKDGGWLLQLRPGMLVAQPVDLERATLANDVVTVAEHVATMSVSATGIVAYRIGELRTGRQNQLTWLDVAGKPLGVIGEPDDFRAFRLSPDGRNVAVVMGDAAVPPKSDIWMVDVARGLRTRFTFASASDNHPLWSPDGRSVVFASARKGHADLYRKSIDGAIGSEELLHADEHDKLPHSWSRDGKFVLYRQDAPNGKGDLWVLPMTGDRKPFPFAQTEFSETQGAYSPDGRWVAFVSDESGSADVYAAPFPGPGARRLISARQAAISQGGVPTWRADGGAIYYIAPDRTLMAVDVKLRGTDLEAGLPRKLFGPISGVGGHNYEVSAEGTRVLTYATRPGSSDGPITLIQNWQPGTRK